jgi:hypothetical protein
MLLDYRKRLINVNIEQIKRAIKEIVLPQLNNSYKAAVVNKTQYEKEDLSLRTIEI